MTTSAQSSVHSTPIGPTHIWAIVKQRQETEAKNAKAEKMAVVV